MTRSKPDLTGYPWDIWSDGEEHHVDFPQTYNPVPGATPPWRVLRRVLNIWAWRNNYQAYIEQLRNPDETWRVSFQLTPRSPLSGTEALDPRQYISPPD